MPGLLGNEIIAGKLTWQPSPIDHIFIPWCGIIRGHDKPQYADASTWLDRMCWLLLLLSSRCNVMFHEVSPQSSTLPALCEGKSTHYMADGFPPQKGQWYGSRLHVITSFCESFFQWLAVHNSIRYLCLSKQHLFDTFRPNFQYDHTIPSIV